MPPIARTGERPGSSRFLINIWILEVEFRVFNVANLNRYSAYNVSVVLSIEGLARAKILGYACCLSVEEDETGPGILGFNLAAD